jgi:putative SOS response-associated peptidase YedK
MCHRYLLTDLASAVAAFHDLLAEEAGADWTPRYNVALTQRMPVITRRAGKTKLETMRFGIVAPARSPAEKPLLLGNARAETLTARPAFREAVQFRRCLVPADGFYEWEKAGPARLPHFFALKDRQPFFFGGIWEPARGDEPGAFCIVTTTANTLLASIHDRMPVMLGPNSGPAWLGDEPLPAARLAQLCRPLPADRLTSHRVDPRMNNVRYEAPDAAEPLNP